MNNLDSKRLFSTEQQTLKNHFDITGMQSVLDSLVISSGEKVSYLSIMPEPVPELRDQVVMYTGASGEYLPGHLYRCTSLNYVYTWLPLAAADLTWPLINQMCSESSIDLRGYFSLGDVVPVRNTILNTDGNGYFEWQIVDIQAHEFTLLAWKIPAVVVSNTSLALQFDAPQKAADADGVANPGGDNAIQYGSNLYPDSWIDQFLNTGAAASEWGTPATGWHNTPAWVGTTDGFLKGFDADFLSAVKMTDIKVNISVDWREPLGLEAQETLSRKFYLLAREDVGFASIVSGQPEGTLQPLYEGVTDADRIKYRLTDNQSTHWWLRSPRVDISQNVYDVPPSGVLSGGSAINTFGVVPACRIGTN